MYIATNENTILYDKLSLAFQAFRKPDRLNTAKVWIKQAVTGTIRDAQRLNGWDGAVLLPHPVKTVKDVGDQLYHQLHRAGFCEQLKVDEHTVTLSEETAKQLAAGGFRVAPNIGEHNISLTPEACVRLINNERRLSGKGNPVELVSSVAAWVLMRDLNKNDTSPGAEYDYVMLHAPHDATKLDQVKIYTGVKGKVNEGIFKDGETTLAEAMRRPNPIEYLWSQQARVGRHIRKSAPSFRNAGALILIPQQIREATRRSLRWGARNMSLAA